jgi:prepilin-type N-terminal cleavage/methylation domain-containing protein
MIHTRRGFTLIELLVVIGIIAILASVVIVALNPARQFAQARNTQRSSNVNTILNAIGQNMVDNRGNWTCAAGPLPTSSTNMASTGGYNILACIVPTYVSVMPTDPTSGSYVSDVNYNSSYSVVQDAQGRVTVSAPSTEQPLAVPIAVTR